MLQTFHGDEPTEVFAMIGTADDCQAHQYYNYNDGIVNVLSIHPHEPPNLQRIGKPISLDEVMMVLRTGRAVEVKIRLNGGIVSRHTLSMQKNGKMVDHFHVDGGNSRYTPEEYKASWYGKAFEGNAVILERINYHE